MFFLNLTLAQFLALFGGVSALTVALYLLDRSRSKQVVATLRFWLAAGEPALTRHRRRIQQPWSLILQLAGIALLLAGIAELRLGSRASPPRDHVLVLETSAWMAARVDASRTLMDEARTRARQYVNAVTPGDRIMLVRADGLATPATGFESDRDKIREGIARSAPGSTALDLVQAYEFARRVQSLSAERAGEIVFVGYGRIPDHETAAAGSISSDRLRIIPVEYKAGNCGIRKIGLRRSATEPGVWEVYVSARNYGAAPRTVHLSLAFGGAPVGSRTLVLVPGADREASFEFRTRAAGELEARLHPDDALAADNRAVLELPQERALEVSVYSDEPESLRPLLTSNPLVHAVFRPASAYDPRQATGLVVLDRFRPPSPPAGNAIWIDPPVQDSPVAVRSRMPDLKLTRWNSAHPLGAGLRTSDLKLEQATVFEAAPGDIRVAESASGPVVVARSGAHKSVVIGFHPAHTGMRYELATPILFANVLRWMAPDVFRRWEITGGSVGTVDVALDPEAKPEQISVSDNSGKPVPFTARPGSLRFFAGAPGTVQVNAGDRELIYSLTLPELSDAQWTPPPQVKRGLAGVRRRVAGSSETWPIAAVLGALALLAEWVLYGRYRRRAARPEPFWRLPLRLRARARPAGQR